MQYGSGDADDYIGIRLDYQTYHALNWTIVADENGTTFTSRETLPICAAGGLTTPMGSSGSATAAASSPAAAERQSLQRQYLDAQRAASRIATDAGAGGTVVAPASQFEQIGRIADADGAGPADVIAPNPLTTRGDGADDPRGSAYGKAI